MTHSLTLGSLLLTDSFPDADHDYRFDVLADGVGFGVAEGVKEVVTSLLSDGDLTRTTRYGNREVSFVVEITGPDLASLAQGEAALRREIGRGNTLTWQPPDDFAVPTVFEVVDSEMAQRFDDLDELNKRRKYTLTLTCSATRSADLVTVDALEVGGGATTVVDTCDSATGWTATVNDAPATADPAWLGTSGSVWVVEVSGPGPQMMTLTRTGSFSVSTTPYIRVIVRANEPQATTARATVDGVARDLTLLAQRKSPANGDEYEFVFVVPTGSTTVTSLTLSNYSYADFAAFGVSEVTRMGTPPSQTPRQVSRILEVGGTERTPASIRVESPSSSILGVTIVHTSPEDGSGYAPPLRRWRVAGNTVTTDATTLSGGREPLHPDPVQFKVPTTALPEGGYLLCAFIRVGTAGKHEVYFSGVTELPPPNDGVGMGPVVNKTLWDFKDANVWNLVPLGIMSLPTVRTSAGSVVIGIERGDTSASMDVDEAWLFRVDDDCALSGANLPATNLWLDSPTSATPVPTVWMGDDESARTHPGDYLFAQGNHVLSPEGTAVFTATLGVEWPEVSATCYRRWHSNAAE